MIGDPRTGLHPAATVVKWWTHPALWHVAALVHHVGSAMHIALCIELIAWLCEKHCTAAEGHVTKVLG